MVYIIKNINFSKGIGATNSAIGYSFISSFQARERQKRKEKIQFVVQQINFLRGFIFYLFLDLYLLFFNFASLSHSDFDLAHVNCLGQWNSKYNQRFDKAFAQFCLHFFPSAIIAKKVYQQDSAQVSQLNLSILTEACNIN